MFHFVKNYILVLSDKNNSTTIHTLLDIILHLLVEHSYLNIKVNLYFK
jgi:hypothetical protein